MSLRVLAERAEQVWLCLFDEAEAPCESVRVPLRRASGGYWVSAESPLAPGQVYGLRAEGPWRPEAGDFYDVAKLLIDPRARALVGPTAWHPVLTLDQHGLDSAPRAPRSLWIDDSFDWGDDRRPGIPWQRTAIYEAHVKGLTWLHPEVPTAERGTYLGLTHPAVLEHFRRLGVTAIELLPVQHFLTERHLVERGLSNYWGYNPLGLYAPHAGYASTSDPVSEFKEMVRRLHQAGLEVILDLVFNHTAESDTFGPTVSFRGLDNRLFYRQDADDPNRYQDYSGCGNTLDLSEPRVTELVVDCLRYWADEMHVDGFRLDLASALGRDREGRFSAQAPLFEALAADSAFTGIKWIAEPWDAAPNGYQLGSFPPGWFEWNDRFRDATRRYWLGDRDAEPELHLRLDGSPDLFPPDSGRAGASVNFVTSHDGFTLADLVSYSKKRNGANGEGNRDGHPGELSSGFGAEGSTLERTVLERRRRARRGLLASLLLAEGVPMISHGDELGRSQLGNNNAYCQDNELTWVDWSTETDDVDFIGRLLRYRRRRQAARGG